MKQLLFVLTLIWGSASTYGQNPNSLFYLNRKELKKKLVRIYDCTDLGSAKSHGIIYESFHQNNGSDMIACFFNKAGLCFKIMTIHPNSEMVKDIKELNQSYIEVSPFKWRDKRETTSIELSPIKEQKMFSITFTYINLE